MTFAGKHQIQGPLGISPARILVPDHCTLSRPSPKQLGSLSNTKVEHAYEYFTKTHRISKLIPMDILGQVKVKLLIFHKS